MVRHQNLNVLVIFLLVCLGIGYTGHFFTNTSLNSWYPTLLKPSWNPPNWVFPIAWTTLYILMAISAWLVYRSTISPFRTLGLRLFAFQLILNALWSPLFFGMQSPFWALIELVVLLLAVFFTMIIFWRVKVSAGILLIPYFLWLCYALTLNAAIWWLNR